MRALGLVVMAAIALSGCAQPPVLKIEAQEVRLSATPKGPAAAYFIIRGGPVEERLMDVTADYAIRSELHESMTTGNMASMKPIEGGVAVPAGGTVKFERGGKHVMLFDVSPGIPAGRRMPMTFTFASGTRLKGNAVIKRAGAE